MNGIRTKILLLLLLIAVGAVDGGRIFAQTAPTGCPSIMASGSVSGRDTVLPHGGCITLRAEVVATATTANDYTVSSIAYNPPFSFQSGTRINLTTDDYYAAVINLPFPFCFYGNTYTQACVGANGVVSFNVSNNGGYCAYNYSSYVPIPNANFPPSLLNAIYGVCEDIWPGHSTGGGRIFQGVLGTYPCRTACISYDQCPLFGNYTTNNSYQIVIYEGTNIIDVYIKNRNCCSTTNRGQGIVGLQNANGTKAITAPNRNGGTWTTTNEAWRFTPVGTPNYTVSWYYGTDTSANGQLLKIDTIHSDTAMSRVQVCPIAADTFTARLKYVACNGDSFDMISTTVITNAGLSYFDTVLCASGCYTFNGKSYCSPGRYIDTLKDSYGYDSIISRITISDTLRDTIHRTICAGTSFDTNGQRYYLAGQYVQHLRQPDSCYNNLVINLSVSDTLRDTIYRTICAGTSFDTNGQRYYLSGQYVQHLRQPDSCYNNLVINLAVSDTLRDTIYRTICAGTSFDTNGQRYYLAGQYVQRLRQPDSCFNNLVINLAVSDTLRDTIYRTICAGTSFDTNGQRYYHTGQYVQYLRQPDSCFNNLVINLSVRDTIRDTIHRTICAGTSFDTNGQRYYIAGQYVQHLRQPDSCYNNLVINLTVRDTIRDTIYRTICAGASFDTNGQRYYLTGQYVQYLRQPDSCYNNLVINLTVSDTLRDTIYRTICAGTSFDTNGQRYYLAGQYVQHLRQPDSCFNNLVINLTVSDTLRDTIHRTICAGASFDTNGQRYYHAGQYVQHLRQPDSCYNNLVINLSVSDTLRDTIYRTICAGTSFDTNGQRYYLAGQYVQRLRQPDSCYNNLVINLTVSDTLRDTINRTICAGASFDTNGQCYCLAGQYIQHLRQPDSCYNNLVINLTVSDTLRDTIYRTICAGTSFDTNGQRYYLAGQYVQHLHQPDSCYNNLVINLTVSDTLRDTIYRTICAGASFDTNGQRYYFAGQYVQYLRQPDSCFNNLVINLTVSDTLRDTIYRTICAGASFDTNGQRYYLAGQYVQHLRQPDSCFNNLVINLTVLDTLRDTIYRTICAGASFDTNGQRYYLAGHYIQHLRQPDSCYNNLVINLSVRDTIRDTINRTICAGSSFDTNGQRYISQGFYSQLLRDASTGCYNRLYINLIVHDTFRNVVWQNICAGATFSYGGQSYYLQGTYLQQRYTVYGCDSITEIHLTVNDTIRDTVEHSVCAGQTVNVNGQTYYRDGWYRQHLRTSDGCDSILHIRLNVADTIRDTLYFSVCAGKTIDVNGITYANRGWHRQSFRTPDGCDSILHFALMVDDTIRSHDYDTICDGQLYHYHDSTYSVAGAYRHLLKTPEGCDSIVTMHLFVRDTSLTHLYDTIERGDSSFFFGQWYTEQGVYSHVLTRSDNGCDSTILFHLKVCHTIYTYLYDTICTNHSYRFGDTVIARQGVYSRVEYTQDFCDSIIVLNLAVIDYPTLSLVDSGIYCDGGVATLAAVTNANYITWMSIPPDSTLIGQEHEFVLHVSPQRYVEYIATVDIQPYNCETSDVISLNKPSTLIADIAINPAEITNDNLAVTFADNSIGEVVSRKWMFHEDDPTTRDRQVLNDSIVHYTASPISDSLEVTLIVANGYGCHDTARNIYPIYRGDIWVPNAFTPGRRSAGQNSLFKVKYNNILEYEINIYTREGLLVFHSTDPEISWNGTYNYKDCKSGSYVYVVRYTTKKHPKLVLEQKGMVLLIR